MRCGPGACARTEGIVPNSGHWVMEENPEATIALVSGFLD
jgi:pimeloyl-ACP methyl ester carboxylesterase